MNRKLYVLFLAMLWIGNPAEAEAQITVSGKVLGFVYNRIGDYDGLRLQTDRGTALLSFPPHAAARVRQLAAAGQRITAANLQSAGKESLSFTLIKLKAMLKHPSKGITHTLFLLPRLALIIHWQVFCT